MDRIPLYWSNPEKLEIETRVKKALPENHRWKIQLESPPFYPGGGKHQW